MDFGQAFLYGKEALNAAGIEDAATDAFYLLEHVTGLSRAAFLLHKLDIISEQEIAAYRRLIEKRATHIPCQYLLGYTEFMGLTFRVTPAVLIPRQDTELLAEEAIYIIRKLVETDGREHTSARSALSPLSEEEDKKAEINAGTSCRLLDLCTGSGALAVSVKHYCPAAEVTASDISPDALAVAEENARDHHCNITFRESDMFQKLEGEVFDVILSNPPYITEEEYRTLMPEVKEYEPRMALLAGKDGLDCYRVIAKEAGSHLKAGGRLLLEIGWEQADAVSGLLAENGFSEITVTKDLNGKDRMVCGRLRAKQAVSYSYI